MCTEKEEIEHERRDDLLLDIIGYIWVYAQNMEMCIENVAQKGFVLYVYRGTDCHSSHKLCYYI